MRKHTDLRAYDFAQPPVLRLQPRLAKATTPEAGYFVNLGLLYTRQVLRVIIRQKDNGTLSRGQILKGYHVAGLPQRNIIWLILYLTVLQVLTGFGVQTARYAKKFGYHSSFPWYDRPLCQTNINEFTCFTLYSLTVTRNSTRGDEIYNLLFHIFLMLQFNTHRKCHGPHYHQYTDITPLPSSTKSLSPTFWWNFTAKITFLTITNLS
jgi:hypothetical protein